MTANTEEFVELGDLVIDTVSGLQGIATAATSFLNGCRRVQIVPRVKDGAFQDERWFDEPQLQVLERSHYKRPTPKSSPTGGDRPDCPAR